MSGIPNAAVLRQIHRSRTVPNGLALFGDSITFNGGRHAVNPTTYKDIGFWTWAQFLLGHAFTFLGNFGVSGEKTTPMLNRLNDVVNVRPGWVHILMGTNDVNNGIDISVTIANLDYVLNYFETAGIRVILGTIPPQNTLTATGAMQHRRLNAWIRMQGHTRRSVVIVDYFAALVNPINGNYAGSGFLVQTNDGTHPAAIGAYVMGKTLAAALRAVGINAPAELFSDEADTTNTLLYGQFSGAGVGAAPTGWTGSTPTGSGTVAYSKPARTDIATQSPAARTWQQLLLAPSAPGVATSMTLTNSNTRGGSWSVGDTIAASIVAKATALDQAPATLTQAGMSFSVQCLSSGFAVLARADDLYWVPGVAGYGNHTLDDRQGVFMTPPVVIPANTVYVQVQITIGGGGTYCFDQAGIQNLSRYGLTA
ncbi:MULTISPECIES: SGNH/GDSL hydrolase family protein [unclassified Cryobacterium]|uniref:SGNH/GDSL hydrolase family protein n=1 Tax=unclassified Cryobacterium TaxID=2649013 RepID=UPI00141A6E38|nr:MULTISPECIES: SGNH/GDSL hydrolase family protein [unclassified Cryobacterium]